MGLFRPTTSVGRPKTAQPDLRGRISGPIPMDEDFPIRNIGAGITQEDRIERQPESHVEDQPNSISRSGNTPSDVARTDKADSVTPSGPSQASYVSASPRQHRATRSSTLRYSVVSDGEDIERPQRKKSTLKSTLGKLFKRKKKSTSGPFTSEAQNAETGDSALPEHDSPASDRARKENEPKRSASLPITEYNKALRSHSTGPDDIVAVGSARNSLQIDPVLLRRRAASSNRILSGRIKDFDGELIGLSPRPASTHGRGGHTSSDDDPDDIGRAITSDSHNNRRRSRSLSQLQDAAISQVQVRKRSDEIRYWRASHNPAILSPNSSTANNDDTGAVDVDVVTPPDSPQQLSPKTPPQPFNFGPMLGMKITQAASLEDRLTALEVHNQKLEKLVSQLFQVIPGVNNYVPETPGREQSRGSMAPSATYTPNRPIVSERSDYMSSSHPTEESPGYSHSQQSNESFGDGNTFIESVPPSMVPPRQRPTSNATVRGATSLPALLGENVGPFTADHYTTLKALLDTERDARQALEARVTRLNHRFNLLSRTSHKLETASTTYSTVSAFEHDDDEPLTAGAETESEAYKTPREEESGHGFGAFGEELRDEEVDGSRKKAARTLSLSQLTLKRPLRPQQETGVEL
ncbi:uncharacterized protein F4822DRAFT_229852 [Hypoxylon trugodes]|uniref:uncharacterized protein n=1 Tax=Hypoxylon trugodes TaxID=326681 RepID=UPI002194CB5A|nr:uncharacterized protein F4822DRAFT_229852 [Hypoxylon trugodes]KAI1390225.1 hypothetical protein F4822DRAFT_229852 [Hypoxylon trugodes]